MSKAAAVRGARTPASRVHTRVNAWPAADRTCPHDCAHRHNTPTQHDRAFEVVVRWRRLAPSYDGCLESVEVSLEANYILHVPRQVDPQSLLVLTLHGYGSNPEEMLRLSLPALGENSVVASLRGPHHYYLSGNPTATETQAVGYSWGTRRHPEQNIRLHHEIVRGVAAQLRARFSIPARRTLLMGFSQPVGLNYRFIGTHPEHAGGILALCGGVPKDWEEDKYQPVSAPILHISRSEDEFFPAQVAQGFPDRLRHHATDVEFHLIPGAHRFPSKAAPLIRAWMARVFQ
jgi:predicted esterase